MITITETSNKELLAEIKKQLAENNNHCPCQLDKNSKDTLCMCKQFRDEIHCADSTAVNNNHTIECHCGRYVAHID